MFVPADGVVIGRTVRAKIDRVTAGIDPLPVPLPIHPDHLVSKEKSRVILEEHSGGSLVVA